MVCLQLDKSGYLYCGFERALEDAKELDNGSTIIENNKHSTKNGSSVRHIVFGIGREILW